MESESASLTDDTVTRPSTSTSTVIRWTVMPDCYSMGLTPGGNARKDTLSQVDNLPACGTGPYGRGPYG